MVVLLSCRVHVLLRLAVLLRGGGLAKGRGKGAVLDALHRSLGSIAATGFKAFLVALLTGKRSGIGRGDRVLSGQERVHSG